MNNTTNQSRVLVISPDVKHDLSSARSHGELRYLLRESGSPFTDISERIHDAITDFEFSEERDLVVVVGPQLHVAVMVGHLLAHFGKIRALVFDSKQDKYCAKWIYSYENEHPPGDQDVLKHSPGEDPYLRGLTESRESPDGPERASETGAGIEVDPAHDAPSRGNLGRLREPQDGASAGHDHGECPR